MCSDEFKRECRNDVDSNRKGKIILNENFDYEYNEDNYLQSFTIDSGCYNDGNIVGSVYITGLTAEIIGNPYPVEKKRLEPSVGITFKRENDTEETEYMNLGYFLVDNSNTEITNEAVTYTAYDVLFGRIEEKYTCSLNFDNNNLTYTIWDIYEDLCQQLRIRPTQQSFLNSDLPVEGNPFKNGETNRVVLKAIATVACSYVTIDSDNSTITLDWFNTNESPSYTFTTDDYSTLDGEDVVVGPINSVVIKSSEIDDENVSKQDNAGITFNGLKEIVISEDYFLYTEALRRTALNRIYSRLHNFTYTNFKLTTYHGLPFLKKGAKIRVYKDENSFFDTYILKHQFTFDGAFKSVLEAPALTEVEIATRNDLSLGEKLTKTQIIVNKQKGTIQSLAGELNSKYSTMEQTANALTQRVGSVETSTNALTGEIATVKTSLSEVSQKANQIELSVKENYNLISTQETLLNNAEFDNVAESEPVTFDIHPINEDILGVFPANNLYPENSLYPMGMTLVFYNKTTGKRIEYDLPVELYQLNGTYDEISFNYDTKKIKLIKRIGVNSSGNKYILASEVTSELGNYPTIELTSGNYRVFIQGLTTCYLKVRLVHNSIYTDQFVTNVKLESKLKVTATEISQTVKKEIKDVNDEIRTCQSQIKSLSNSIEMKVEETIEKNQEIKNIKAELGLKIDENNLISKINGSADIIKFKAGLQVSIDSPKFKLSTDGKITATGGTIGGFSIGENTLKFINSNNTSSTLLLDCNPDHQYAIAAGSSDSSTAPFRVRKNGDLIAKSAQIEGKVTATDGKIGGFNIGQYTLKGGSGSNTVGMCSTEGQEWAFWAGASTGERAPFRIGHNGSVKCSELWLSGGAININDVFKVDSNGHLTTTSATINNANITGNLYGSYIEGGRIQATDFYSSNFHTGNISGSTISGSTFDLNGIKIQKCDITFTGIRPENTSTTQTGILIGNYFISNYIAGFIYFAGRNSYIFGTKSKFWDITINTISAKNFIDTYQPVLVDALN